MPVRRRDLPSPPSSDDLTDEPDSPGLSSRTALVAVAALAAGALVVAVLLLVRSRPAPLVVSPRAAPPPSTEAMTPTVVVVHVSGAVARSGVAHLPSGARVIDAVGWAGGLAADADPDAVNLARLVHDGEQVHIPRHGEPAPSATPSAGPLDLNRATAAELEELPGIGPVLAQRIVDHRTAHGPFGSVDDLGEVTGVGDKLLAGLRDLVTVTA